MNHQTLHIILDNIRSRENVGSIFRTADAAGVSKLYLCGITPTPPHHKISKTALGAEEFVVWEHRPQTWRVIERLKKEGYRIMALENRPSATNIFDIHKASGPVALVVGNEVSGLSEDIIKRCNTTISIPMKGKKESLNVAVAFGIAVYQILK